MALRGNLRDFSLPDVFQLVTLSGKTGVLRIKRDDAEGSVWFRDGAVFFAQSDWHHEPLGARMVTAGRLTPNALARALEVQKVEPAGGRRLGQILVDEGYVSDKVLEAFVQEQIQDTIFDLFRWDEGDFDFEPLETAPEEDIGLSVSIENVVMEGSRRLEEWNRIKKKIPSMEIVFKMATAPGEGTFDISLKPTEWNLLLKVDGTRSVSELARETGRTDFEVARVVYGLFSAGLLEVASDEEVERLRAERTEMEAVLAAERARTAEASAPVPAVAAVPVPTAVEAPASAPATAPEQVQPTPQPVPPSAAPASVAPPSAPTPEHVVEEPAFLIGGLSAPGGDDAAVFEEVMGAMLDTSAAASVPAQAAPTSPVAEAQAAAAEPEPAPVVRPEPAAAPAAPASSVYVFDDQPPAPPSAPLTAPAVEPAFAPEALESQALEPTAPAAQMAGETTLTDLQQAAEGADTGYPVAPIGLDTFATDGSGEELPTPPVSSEDLSGLLGTLGIAEPASVVEPEDTQEQPESSATTGDYARDLMALGLGEAPAPAGPVAAPVAESPAAGEREMTIAELEAAAAKVESGELTIAEIEATAQGVVTETVSTDTSDLADLLNSLGGPDEPAAAVIDTSGALDLDEQPAPSAAGASGGGVISTDAFLADFGSSDVSFSSGMGDELTALTGGGSGRARPNASAAKIPEGGSGSAMLQRDSHVDKDLLLKIIDGVQKL